MKTFSEVIESPRIVIEYDPSQYSPRSNFCAGIWLVKNGERFDDRVSSHNDRPKTPHTAGELWSLIKDTECSATSTDDHIKLLNEATRNVYYIFPTWKYEHSSVAYGVGKRSGFDSSTNGFYFIPKSDKEIKNEEHAHGVISMELKEFSQYANGEIYSITIYDVNGDVQDCYGGFYSIDDMKDILPADLQGEDLEQYLKI